eukprot:g1499.t1
MRWLSDAGLYSPKRRENELVSILDALGRFGDLEEFEESNQELSELVEKEALRLARHEFLEYLGNLYQHLHALLSNGSEKGLLIAVHAIDQLIDVKLLRQESAKLTKLVEFLSTALERLMTVESDRRHDLMCLVCQTFGRLIKSGGPTTAQKASKQIDEMLDWLHNQPFQSCTALKMLTELAKNAPAQFSLQLDQFIVKSHDFLFHEDDWLRFYTLKALKACLGVVKQRASGKRQRWFQDRTLQLINAVHNGHILKKQQALKALHLFIKHSAGNLLGTFPEIANLVFSLTVNNEDQIQELVVEIIPSLAAMCPQNFYSMYLNQSMELLMSHLRNKKYQKTVLDSIPELVQSLVHLGWDSPSGIGKFRVQELADEISRILSEISEASIELIQAAMKCVGYLAAILQEEWRPHGLDLLPQILTHSVDESQIEALKNIVEVYPDTITSIQDHFLNFVQFTLSNQTSGFDTRMMVWNILSTFHFEIPMSILRLINESLDDHLYNQRHPVLRLTCAKALENILDRLTVHETILFEEMSELIESYLDHLTTTAVLDVSSKIRFELVSDLLINADLHERLSQDKTVLRLAYSLYDESFPIRQSSIQLLGALGRHNYGAVHPPLHGLLIKILRNFEFSGDLATTSRLTQDSAMLLQSLLLSEPRSVELYISQIVEILISKLEMYMGQTVICKSVKDPTSEAISSLLLCLMEVASSKTNFMEHSLRRIATILSTLMKDQSDKSKQFIAIKTLGKITEQFQDVFVNYLVLPEILTTFQEIKNGTLKSSEGNKETEAMDSAIFILSQWDPIFLRLVSTSSRAEILIPTQSRPEPSSGGTFLTGHSSFTFPTDEAVVGDEEYYNSEAINALMTALEDTRSTDSVLIVKSLTSILQMLPRQGAFYLQRVFPVLTKVIRQADEKLRILLFVHLSDLVRIVGDHVAPFTDVLMKLCFQFWNSSPELTVHALNLISELIKTLKSSFENYFHDLVPRLCQILSSPGDFQLTEPVFQLLQSCEKQIGAYFPVLFPLLLQFVQRVPTSEDQIPLPIQREVLKTLRCLLLHIEFKVEEKHLFASELFLTLIGLMKEEKSLLSDSKETIVVTMVVLGSQVSRVFAKQIEKVMEPGEDGLLERTLERLQTPVLTENEVFSPDEIESLKPITSSIQFCSTMNSDLFPLDIVQLVRTWDASDRSTTEDWEEWIRSLSVEFLRQSSSQALRACYSLAQVNPMIARSLFKFSLLSIWSRLDEECRVQFQQALETVMMTPALPMDVVQPIIDLGEYLAFIEQQEVTVSEELKPLNGLLKTCTTFSRASHFRMNRQKK